uniref:NBS-containing resistance-like protein n=1 Tax=Tanacetum cinerariifolium TaxID=118510 RepID=A0A6L2K8Y0_TANCI|nr:NBS-containing resistance-like protein [Tanacetum cinerariifolium]
MPSVAPALTLVEKLYAVHNITNLVPVKLDLDELNYSSWRYFFTIHCNNFNVLKHIEPKTDDASTSTPPTEEWLTADSIVKSWIILTLSPSLQKQFIKISPTTARDQSADEYFTKIDSLVTLLSDPGSDVSKYDVVTYAINGLSDKYGSLAQIIAHKDPFPDLATIRSMVSTEEMRLRSKSPIQPTNMNASAPQVLLAASNIPRGGDNRNTRNHDNRKPNTSTDVCLNFGRGFFYMTDLGPLNYFLGVSVTRDTSGVFLSQQKYDTKRQFTISRSSAEAKYRGVANAVAETCWLRNLLCELHTPLSTATLVYCDNVSAVYLFSNPVQYQRTKHIEIDVHFVRDLVSTGRIRVLHVPSHYQLADYFVWL